ncbi:MaoC family dehydratase N-terminal domain-containing protein [Amycolatopsis sp. QT-25]|uniref:MaoC family dehydratase N-terminal domain-containing protein n=1 Tax=Amycolatopsis sp. QT-25 TaxID=3034022 RepID=UPI0023EC0A67|nr:MaoC family dehydratase N-terminal domain-containing protein [Amycolatopsis sp. QT-25]WET80232.1 MaoC family dehydratase N-terminal domain-containing protein [Amycolatopsis sp. QT-25]
MALDQSFTGRVYPPTSTYEVSREKIREFAEALGDTNPLYRDTEAAKAAGHPDVIAPPTFLTIINLASINAIVSDPELGLDYSRMVHGDQRFTYTRPVHAGDVLSLTTYIDTIMTRAGNDFINLRAEISGADGGPIATTNAQLVVRGEGA